MIAMIIESEAMALTISMPREFIGFPGACQRFFPEIPPQLRDGIFTEFFLRKTIFALPFWSYDRNRGTYE